MSQFTAFHWPDHVIGKRESRRIREEHNALYNSHAEIIAVLEFWVGAGHLQTFEDRERFRSAARAVLARARQ